MLAIVFTTTEEARSFVRAYTSQGTGSPDEGASITLDDLVVAVTGPGKIKATLATDQLLRSHDVTTLLHAGVCDALNDELESGTLFGATHVVEGDRVELNAPTYPRMPLDCPYEVPFEGTIVSQDRVTENDEDSYWERIGDARDSTAYAVAYVAAQYGTSCHVVKALSRRGEGRSDDESDDNDGALATLTDFLIETVRGTDVKQT